MATLNIDGVDSTTGQSLISNATDSLNIPLDNLNGSLSVSKGGTGATTAEDARINLSSQGILSTTASIDLKTIASTNLYTVPTGKTAIITGVYVYVTADTAITIGATAGVGTNGSQDNIYPSQVLTGILATNALYDYPNGGSKVGATATQVISFGVDVGATGTSQTATVILCGYLI